MCGGSGEVDGCVVWCAVVRLGGGDDVSVLVRFGGDGGDCGCDECEIPL